jgi:hypothetical protein
LRKQVEVEVKDVSVLNKYNYQNLLINSSYTDKPGDQYEILNAKLEKKNGKKILKIKSYNVFNKFELDLVYKRFKKLKKIKLMVHLLFIMMKILRKIIKKLLKKILLP